MLDGMKSLLVNNPNFEVVAQTTNPNEAIDLLIKHQAKLLITDINMKELSGIELCKQAKAQIPTIKVLALSMFGDKETITQMLESGVDGYLLKNTGSEELIMALTKLMNGEVFFSNDVTLELLKSITHPKLVQTDTIALTPREIEIVKLIADEFNNSKIGEKLFISERTVETHRKNIFRKTNTKSVAGLIKYAIDKKII
jgi:DNA-binding NarL/FixJ family response regulator